MSSYYCHQCERTVVITAVNDSADISCPLCHGGFLEEIPDDDAPTNPNPNSLLFPDPFSHFADPFFSTTSSPVPTTTTHRVGGRGPIVITSTTFLSPPPQHVLPPSLSAGFDPFAFFQSYLGNLPPNVQLVVESGGGIGGVGDATGSGRAPLNFGDYLIGPGLEQLIQHLAENDPNRYGTPPAAKTAVEGLPTVTITDEVVNSESNACAVCMTEFESGGEAKQMPCKHLYHPDCILPWLQLHNSCPVCRFELPTDDQDYENRKAGSGSHESGVDGFGGSSSEGRGGGEGGNSERMFQISLPWPFSQLVGRGGGGNGSGRDGGGSSSGGQQQHQQQGGNSGGTNFESLD